MKKGYILAGFCSGSQDACIYYGNKLAVAYKSGFYMLDFTLAGYQPEILFQKK
jgi:hypothetical protein